MTLPVEDQRAERLKKLTEVSRAVTYASSLGDILRLATDRAADLLEADKAVLMLADEDGLLHVRASYGVDEAVVEQFREPLAETLIQRLQGLMGERPHDCFLGVPLVVRGEVIGLLAVMRPQGKPCTAEEEWLLSALADQTAAPLDNARLNEEVRRGFNVAQERALATLAHDLRSPLNAVEGYAYLMEQEMAGPVTEQQRDLLRRIRASNRHLLALQERMLEMARLSSGVLGVELGPVRAAAVMEEAALMIRHEADVKGHVLHLERGGDPVVWADADRLRQVLINVLSNAITYTPSGGRIEMRAAGGAVAGERWGTIAVSDTGPGIPPDQLETIFKPYYQLEAASNGPRTGAGLGLAISRGLIGQMGGEISVDSAPGRGSTFVVRLRLSDTASASA